MKWGILGCANIARKNCRAMHLSRTASLVAIASRSVEKATKWASDNGLDSSVKLYGTYEALLDDPDIEAVYIPLPTTLHFVWGIAAAEKKKHILLEKPAALNADELRAIIKACRDNHVTYMDAVMFMHHDRLAALRRELSDPLTGRVSRVYSQFCFNGTQFPGFFDNNIRCLDGGDPLGALGDLGWYCIRIGLIAFNKGSFSLPFQVVPFAVKASALQWSTSGRVPFECSGQVYFRPATDTSNVSAENLAEAIKGGGSQIQCLEFCVSFLLPFVQNVRISIESQRPGECGDRIISYDDAFIPRHASRAVFTVETFPPSGPLSDLDCKVISMIETKEVTNCDQEANMFDTFEMLARDKLQHQNYHVEISLLNQCVLDACLESMKQDGKLVAVHY